MPKIVNVKISDVKTIHTNDRTKVDQPIVEFTLELMIDNEKKELKFTEMLCNLADLDSKQLLEHLNGHIQDYVRTAYKGRDEINSQGNWDKTANIIGKTYTITV
jgi:hypothetical protein